MKNLNYGSSKLTITLAPSTVVESTLREGICSHFSE